MRLLKPNHFVLLLALITSSFCGAQNLENLPTIDSIGVQVEMEDSLPIKKITFDQYNVILDSLSEERSKLKLADLLPAISGFHESGVNYGLQPNLVLNDSPDPVLNVLNSGMIKAGYGFGSVDILYRQNSVTSQVGVGNFFTIKYSPQLLKRPLSKQSILDNKLGEVKRNLFQMVDQYKQEQAKLDILIEQKRKQEEYKYKSPVSIGDSLSKPTFDASNFQSNSKLDTLILKRRALDDSLEMCKGLLTRVKGLLQDEQDQYFQRQESILSNLNFLKLGLSSASVDEYGNSQVQFNGLHTKLVIGRTSLEIGVGKTIDARLNTNKVYENVLKNQSNSSNLFGLGDQSQNDFIVTQKLSYKLNESLEIYEQGTRLSLTHKDSLNDTLKVIYNQSTGIKLTPFRRVKLEYLSSVVLSKQMPIQRSKLDRQSFSDLMFKNELNYTMPKIRTRIQLLRLESGEGYKSINNSQVIGNYTESRVDLKSKVLKPIQLTSGISEIEFTNTELEKSYMIQAVDGNLNWKILKSIVVNGNYTFRNTISKDSIQNHEIPTQSYGGSAVWFNYDKKTKQNHQVQIDYSRNQVFDFVRVNSIELKSMGYVFSDEKKSVGFTVGAAGLLSSAEEYYQEYLEMNYSYKYKQMKLIISANATNLMAAEQDYGWRIEYATKLFKKFEYRLSVEKVNSGYYFNMLTPIRFKSFPYQINTTIRWNI